MDTQTPAGPQPFPWQSGLWQGLVQQYQQGRLPHALMFSGHQGIGKKIFARALAGYLLCAKPQAGSACGQCKECLLLKAGTHPDLLVVEPDEKSRVIKVDQIRHLKSFAAQTAQRSGFKVVILQPADALNINAANALLKDLEEPAAKTLFMLVSAQPNQIPVTIRSRCNQLHFSVPDIEQSTAWLAARLEDQQDLALLLSLTNNAPLLALELHENDGLAQRKSIFRGLTELQQHKSNPIKVAQDLQTLDLLSILYWMQVWATDLIKIALTGDSRLLKNQDLSPFLVKTAGQVLTNELYLYMDRLQEQRQALLSGHNPNKILLLEALLGSWAACFKR